MNLEDELRSALRRREPSPDFTERVLARVAAAPVRRASQPWVRWVAAIAAALLLAAGRLESPLSGRAGQVPGDVGRADRRQKTGKGAEESADAHASECFMRAAALSMALLCARRALPAQQLKWNSEKLAARASDTVDVSLVWPPAAIRLKFLSDDDKDEAKMKKLVAGLKGIYVKSFEFKKPGEYSADDVTPSPAPLDLPDWQRIVGTHSNEEGETVEVYIKNEAKGIGGLAIIATGAEE